MTEDCLHSEYVTCGVCNPRPRRHGWGKLDQPIQVIRAGHFSTCPRCDREIARGEMIGLSGDGDWMCVEHFENPEPRERSKWV